MMIIVSLLIGVLLLAVIGCNEPTPTQEPTPQVKPVETVKTTPEPTQAKVALILVDIQNDYFPGGRNPLREPEKAAEQARVALDYFREHRLPLFHIQHISLYEGATFLLPDTDGIKTHDTVKPASGEPIILKHYPDSFFQTELHEKLSALGIKRLVICGMMTHMCIDTTVRAAKNHGYEVVLLSDACTTRDLTWENNEIPAETVHNTFMAALQGRFAKIIKANEIDATLK
ncbi:MAG: cysteine hydrolase [Planctomycetaceae bacterium]|jgi:nicotinamidase-related amidase|nr:cysteine hydrolase [Planctomycetaceae bacterium]